MGSKRANGEGSIYKVGSRWRVSVTIQLTNGKTKRSTALVKSRADAVAKLQELRDSGNKQKAAVPSDIRKMTLSEYLHYWLVNIVEPSCKPNTIASYRRSVDLHINPRIGHFKLVSISQEHVQAFIGLMHRDGVKTRAAQQAFQTLRRALNSAVAPLRFISNNPSTSVIAAKHNARIIHPFDEQQSKALIERVDGTRWGALFAVAIGCGLRPGELFGLRQIDIDWQKNIIRVRQQALDISGKTSIADTKTTSGTRDVSAPSFVMRMLKDHLAILLAEGNIGSELMFCAVRGGIQTRANFYADVWYPLLDGLKFERRGLHHLRHTYATIALMNRAPLAVVSKSLGHANQMITLKSYSHYLPSGETAAADVMQTLIG